LGGARPIEARLLFGSELYREVLLEKLAHARESVAIATANVKDVHLDAGAVFGQAPDAEGPSGASGVRGGGSSRRGGVSRRRGAGRFVSILELFGALAARGVQLRLLHAELPSRPFRASFDRQAGLVAGGLQLRTCPRVHFKAVIVDEAWVYLGSANLTGAGLGAKGEGKRNFELGWGTEDFDVLDRVQALFEGIWSGAECAGCQLHAVCPDPIGPGPKSGRARSKGGSGLVELGTARRIGR
jgi:PLD-like domain